MVSFNETEISFYLSTNKVYFNTIKCWIVKKEYKIKEALHLLLALPLNTIFR